MALTATEKSSSFESAPVGNHVARCVSLLDLGTHHDEYNGKPRTRNVVNLGFELPMELMQDGRPFVVRCWLTNSLSEKATMRHWLEAWRGREFTPEELKKFDLRNVLDKCCMVQVSRTASNKAKIAAITQLPKGLEVPQRVNEIQIFSSVPEEWDDVAFNALPEWAQNEIRKSDEWHAVMAQRTGNASEPAGTSSKSPFDDMADDIPF